MTISNFSDVLVGAGCPRASGENASGVSAAPFTNPRLVIAVIDSLLWSSFFPLLLLAL
jgi:hypothetical protein